MTAANRTTAAEPMPIATKIKPTVTGKTPDQYMADIHAALGVDHCAFARCWHESTKNQRKVMLELIPNFERERAIGLVNYPFQKLPGEIQNGYKSVIRKLCEFAARGVVNNRASCPDCGHVYNAGNDHYCPKCGEA